MRGGVERGHSCPRVFIIGSDSLPLGIAPLPSNPLPTAHASSLMTLPSEKHYQNTPNIKMLGIKAADLHAYLPKSPLKATINT